MSLQKGGNPDVHMAEDGSMVTEDEDAGAAEDHMMAYSLSLSLSPGRNAAAEDRDDHSMARMGDPEVHVHVVADDFMVRVDEYGGDGNVAVQIDPKPKPKLKLKPPWIEFPFLSEAGRALMSGIAGTMEEEMGPLLLPSQTPADVVGFRNTKHTAHGSVVLRAGKDKGQVSFVLGSWLHCRLTTGTLDIATIIVMLGPEIDAPHFMLEFIQNDNNSLVLLLDLLPRKDVVLDPHYLKRYYEDLDLEQLRKGLDKIPQSKVYVPSSLYVRSLVSPTAFLYKFKTLQHPHSKLNVGKVEDLHMLVKEILCPTSKEVLFKWLDAFKHKARRVHGDESRKLLDRDTNIKEKGIEIDLSSNMPRLFGHEITNRIIQAYRNGI